MSAMTPYAAAMIVNNELKLRGIQKKLPPQMIYSYVAKGYIDSVVVGGKKRISKESLENWLTKYVAKLQPQNEKKEEVDANQLSLDLQ